jgi:Fe-S-cluster containining protein
VQGCSDCCIFREYYPSVEYGKIGVLILPEEKASVERLAKNLGTRLRIIPRLAVGKNSPERIIAYQMMGKNEDGDLCPFLEVESKERSPHGGFKCKIYSDRPLACRAYPVIDVIDNTAKFDSHCQFCKKFSTSKASSEGLQRMMMIFLFGAMQLPPANRMDCCRKAGFSNASSRAFGKVHAHFF